MNKDRRAALNFLKLRIESLVSDLEKLRDEEQDYLDAMPEAFQQGDKGDAAQSAIDAMEEAIEALDGADTALDTAAE